MNLIDVATTNTTGLVQFYNDNSGKPQIKKFANRTIAEFRVRQLIEEMKAVAELDLLEHEMTDTIEEMKTDEVVDEPQTDEVVDETKANRSKGIAASCTVEDDNANSAGLLRIVNFSSKTQNASLNQSDLASEFFTFEISWIA